METTNIITALNYVLADTAPQVQDAFNRGLMLGAGIVAVLLCFSMLRTIPGGGKEEL